MKQYLTLPFDTVPISAYLSSPDGAGPYPGLIVLEEIWGLNEHIRDVCDRFQKEGFVVLSPELLDESGVLEKMSPEVFKQMQSEDENMKHEAQAKMREAMTPINTDEFAKRTVAKLQACVDHLLADSRVNGSVGVLGFCFGGSYAFHLAVEDVRIKAVVPFYGSAPEPLERVASIKAPVLAFYGEEDKRLIEKLPALEGAMKRHGRDFSYMRYPRAGHAFFNDTRPTAYNEDAARDAWERSLAFLHTHLDTQST
jgi:carboxymethylenebutenolidase